jgi:hypothetical protein
MNKLSAAQRLDRAMIRVEETSADLEREAENWMLSGARSVDIRNHRVGLRLAARRYAAALRRLARLTS